ncbi:Cyclopropane-fatty-acyl-phospholipid synthase [Hydrogenobacter thermophilus TK-6]|uniref:Cyclopropane-fatty-acyl-phospholipid synthase n=2 Tax=Hydrogenobacter thermophilus TaxID=940 RepID=D3DHJ5_HYDTT|nr:class I SAM-dependent methyltransferase [Hydrogenobacter thermophilus]ADO45234.1 Cyclopropane-fatty-acyl-phospholipid synthase [Hydrogenobacter thermophilus TK-6]BAI69297.1 cyclopropane-fatty-acyl-phospholipid synthase [Hydrogenobacter thermophilus TK-6]
MIASIVEEVSKRLDGGLCVELPDGKVLGAGKCKVRIKDKDVIKKVLKDPEMGFGEAYIKGGIEVDGDLESFLVACTCYLREKDEDKSFRNSWGRMLLKYLGLLKFLEGKEVRRHYDLGNDFYQLWLDSSMTYSCAFFSNKDQSLEEAQAEKRSIIYEKLQLTDGDSLLDIGCGWGSIILEAPKLYNIEATGITLSKNQYEYVKSRIESEGLKDRVRVYLMHYEDLPKLDKKFNKVVSVGMFEHVGKGRHRKFFRVVEKVIHEGGLFLLHTIGKVLPESQSRWIRKYIFPGGYIPALTEILEASKGLGFNLIDIDDWRLHYYRTLREWRKRFYQHTRDVVQKHGEEFFRMWELYLVSSAVSFLTGSNHLFQILFSKGVLNNYPIMKRQFIVNNFVV